MLCSSGKFEKIKFYAGKKILTRASLGRATFKKLYSFILLIKMLIFSTLFFLPFEKDISGHVKIFRLQVRAYSMYRDESQSFYQGWSVSLE